MGAGRLAKPVVHVVDVFADVRRGWPVVGVREFTDAFLDIEVAVPQQLGDEIRAQVLKFAALREGVALFEQAADAPLLVEFHVLLERPQVREGLRAVREIDRIVPNGQIWRDFRPVFDILHEGAVEFAFVQPVREAAFDGAEPHDHVVGGLHEFWRLPRVLIGQRVDFHCRKFLFDFRRDGVHEMEQGACLAAFLLRERRAVFAFAVVPPVVLRDADGERQFLRMAEPIQNCLCRNAFHIRISQTKLRAIKQPFPFYQRIIFGMRRAVFGKRHQ